MNPSDAVNELLQRGWREQAIADKVGVLQPAINKIKRGRMPRYDTGHALVTLAKSRKNPPRKAAAKE